MENKRKKALESFIEYELTQVKHEQIREKLGAPYGREGPAKLSQYRSTSVSKILPKIAENFMNQTQREIIPSHSPRKKKRQFSRVDVSNIEHNKYKRYESNLQNLQEVFNDKRNLKVKLKQLENKQVSRQQIASAQAEAFVQCEILNASKPPKFRKTQTFKEEPKQNTDNDQYQYQLPNSKTLQQDIEQENQEITAYNPFMRPKAKNYFFSLEMFDFHDERISELRKLDSNLIKRLKKRYQIAENEDITAKSV